MPNSGKSLRLNRLFNNGRTLIMPVDDSMISGPEGGLLDVESSIKEAANSGVNGILCFKGILKRYTKYFHKCSPILNITSSTINSKHTKKYLISSVEESLIMGADAVAVHVNVTSKYEHEMLSVLGQVSKECEILGMPLLAIMYPRNENGEVDNNYLNLKKTNPIKYTALVKHSVRIAVDMGADIIKTQFTGSKETFSEVIKSSCGVPIVIAGGTKKTVSEVLSDAKICIESGGAGICFGRNTYNRTNIPHFLISMKEIIFQ